MIVENHGSRTILQKGNMTVNEIASEIEVSKMTLYKYLRYRKVEIFRYIYQNVSKKSNT
jgi:AcrR family transcriptional regulator